MTTHLLNPERSEHADEPRKTWCGLLAPSVNSYVDDDPKLTRPGDRRLVDCVLCLAAWHRSADPSAELEKMRGRLELELGGPAAAALELERIELQRRGVIALERIAESTLRRLTTEPGLLQRGVSCSHAAARTITEGHELVEWCPDCGAARVGVRSGSARKGLSEWVLPRGMR